MTSPEVRRTADPVMDPVVDRINCLGQFTDPASGTKRRYELEEAHWRFRNQSVAPRVVDAINAQLVALHSQYRLQIEPPSNPREPAVYQSMGISIIDIDRGGRQTDFLQLR
jgi:hypothetical protein